jgi:hypothetical protein
MQQIADWLESFGISEYAQRFAENDVDFTILGNLTDQDLKDLVVASLGHRRKLLRAIAHLRGVQNNASSVAEADAAKPTPLDTAERRQVTVNDATRRRLRCRPSMVAASGRMPAGSGASTGVG